MLTCLFVQTIFPARRVAPICRTNYAQTPLQCIVEGAARELGLPFSPNSCTRAQAAVLREKYARYGKDSRP